MAIKDLKLESVDVSTAFLNNDIDTEIYMKILEGFEVNGELQPGKDLKCWVVRLHKGLYGIKQGPRIWSLKLHSVLTSLGFVRMDCNYLVYVYLCNGVQIMVLVYVDDLLLASNSKSAIQCVKTELVTHFSLHDLGLALSILGMKIKRDWVCQSISLSQLGYIESILESYTMQDCNLALTPIDKDQKLSIHLSLDTPEKKAEMKHIPYHKLIRKLLYLAVATCLDIMYIVRSYVVLLRTQSLTIGSLQSVFFIISRAPFT